MPVSLCLVATTSRRSTSAAQLDELCKVPSAVLSCEAACFCALRQLVRRLMTLADLRAEVDGGASVDEAMERARVFFKERPATARLLRRWQPAQLARAIDRVRATERAMMRGNSAGEILAEAECTAIARAASRFR